MAIEIETAVRKLQPLVLQIWDICSKAFCTRDFPLTLSTFFDMTLIINVIIVVFNILIIINTILVIGYSMDSAVSE
jgi:hypothetical protein